MRLIKSYSFQLLYEWLPEEIQGEKTGLRSRKHETKRITRFLI